MRSSLGWIAGLLLTAAAAHAGEADVVDVKVTAEAGGTWRFDVTVRHADEGWDHHADRWEVLSPDGEMLGVRTLLHPHETEQPFTRSLTGVEIPADMSEVEIRAHDSVHEFGGATLRVQLER
ncbi:MAG: hypothetical protein ACRED5_14820 [Propylenella sp.]